MSESVLGMIVESDPSVIVSGTKFTPGRITSAFKEYLMSAKGENMTSFDAQRLEDVATDFCSEVQIVDGKIVRTSATALVGKVQSGKTTAFAMTMAALSDLKISNFIVLTGTKNSLDDQTVAELKKKFQVDNFDNLDNEWRWRFLEVNAETTSAQMEIFIKQTLQFSSTTDQQQILVMFCLKEATNLKRLNKLIQDLLAQNISLSENVVLYDDEADQGSPLVAPRAKKESTLNKQIRKLRENLGKHIYVPVTATPQALLVQPRGQGADGVRPDSAVLLPPGTAYVGGKDLFLENSENFVRFIDEDDVDSLKDKDVMPPESLQRALSTFLLTAVLMKSAHRLPVSMLIHPTMTTEPQEHVLSWIVQLRDSWVRQYTYGQIDSAECFKYFEESAKDLMTSASHRILQEGFDEKGSGLVNWVESALKITASPDLQVRKVSGPDKFSHKEWSDSPYWILIGGEVLGRGFVLKGLVTTWMPRDTSPNAKYNMDTLQQRARFFGYKRSELDVLRGYFPRSVVQKFEDYVNHEDFLWNFLRNAKLSGESLQDARTIWLHSPEGRGTRSVANRTGGNSASLTVGWTQQQLLYDDSLSQNLDQFKLWASSEVSERWYPPLITKTDINYETWKVGSISLLKLLESWKSLSIDSAILDLLKNRIGQSDAQGYFRIVDMSSKASSAGRRAPIKGFRKLSNKTDKIDLTNPWSYPHFARTINLFSNSTGQEDDKSFDPDARMTIFIYSITPRINNEISTSHKQVGALAIFHKEEGMKAVFGEEI